MAIWQRAVAAFTDKDSRLSERALAELEVKSATKEERALSEPGRRAIQVGRLNRITTFGLSQPDILDYLAPSHFNLDADDWQAYKAAFRTRKRVGEAFKEFMRREYRANINVDAVRQAAKCVVTLPGDLAELGGLLRQLRYIGEVDDLEAALD